MNNKYKPIIKTVSAIIILAFFYFAGYLHGHANLKYESNHLPKIVNRELKKPSSIDFSLFWETYNQIQDNSFAKLDPQKALEGSLKGLVASLGDQFSVYLTKDESTQFMNDLNNKFQGIGAELTIRNGVLAVVSPLKDSPAEKAGLKPKDQIISIDGKDVSGIDLGEAVNLIRGKPGTTVKLVILPNGQKETKILTIIRADITADSVTETKLDNGYVLIRISQFSEDTSSLMNKSAKQLAADKPKGIILDLRNDPGGLLDASIDVSSLFLDGGTVVIEQDKNGVKDEKKTTQSAILKDIPMAVLVNEGSASASEIVSGAIQDRGRGKIIGKTTYGKGSVQELIDLSDKSTLRLTVAEWLTPNGRTISHEGIKPDILSEDDLKTDVDEVVQKAIDTLK